MNAMRSFEDRRAQVRITAAVLIVLSVLSALIAMCLGAAQLPLAAVLDALGAALRDFPVRDLAKRLSLIHISEPTRP